MKAWAAEGGGNCDKRNVFDKRNVVESMGCRGGGKILITRKSGLIAQRQMCVGYEKHGLQRGGGKILIKGMFLIKGML